MYEEECIFTSYSAFSYSKGMQKGMENALVLNDMFMKIKN